MVREMVTIQVGQCGNQIGRRFWSMLLHEKAAEKKADGKCVPPALNGPPKEGLAILESSLKGKREEEGVVAETLRDPMFGELFDATQLVTDVSGAGNNWAHGHACYGPKYGAEIEDSVSTALEACDSPQSFFLMHSMGGGTGSGLGSFVLEQLADLHPALCRFSLAVYPSGGDDVITSPYNAVLSTARLTAHSDCVIPLENAALVDLCARSTTKGDAKHDDVAAVAAARKRPSRAAGFDDVNDFAAQLLSHLTCGARFAGSLNMDVNELATNLVPFPRMHYLTAGFSPLPALSSSRRRSSVVVEAEDASATHPRQLQRLFAEAASPQRRMVRAPDAATRRELTLACAFLARGDVVASDVNCAVEKLRPTLRMPYWNPDGFKIGLCSSPPLNAPRAVLCLANLTSIASTFQNLRDRFGLLYSRRAMVHHYTEYVDGAVFDEALEDLDALIEAYNTTADTSNQPPPTPPRRSRHPEDAPQPPLSV